MELEEAKNALVGAIRQEKADDITSLIEAFPALLAENYPLDWNDIGSGRPCQGNALDFAISALKPESVHALGRLGMKITKIGDAFSTGLEEKFDQLNNQADRGAARRTLRALLDYIDIYKDDSTAGGQLGTWFPINHDNPIYFNLFEYKGGIRKVRFAGALLEWGAAQNTAENSNALAMHALASVLRYGILRLDRNSAPQKCNEYCRALLDIGMDFSFLHHGSVRDSASVRKLLEREPKGDESTMSQAELADTLDKIFATLRAEAQGTLQNYFAEGQPDFSRCIDEQGKLNRDLVALFALGGIPDFFAATRWQGHEREAIRLNEQLAAAADPHWKTQIRERTDFIALERGLHSPAEQLGVQLLASRRPPRKSPGE